MKKIYFLILTLLWITGDAFSQSFYQYKRDYKLSVFGGFGISGYYGDLNNPGDIIDLSGSLTVGGSYKFHPRFSARAQLSYIRVSGKDTDLDEDLQTRVRNLSFKSDLIEFAGLGVYQFINRNPSYYRTPRLSAYAMGGLALTYGEPKAEYQGETYKLREIETEGESYSALNIALPLGLGATYAINEFIHVGAEGLYRWTFTDYLDDVSTVYIDNSTFTDPIHAALADRRQELGLEPAEAGNIRGNPDKNDGYFTLNLIVRYYIPVYPYSRPSGKVKRNKQIQYKAPKPPKKRKRRF